ncbi:MAG TPA: TonB-dependent vitamin B12 receptor [Rhodanobacteraceae bacterium]|nr:TonB-dependent vitamin B12 receptor [Rhodanobacteraceae bacterium]
MKPHHHLARHRVLAALASVTLCCASAASFADDPPTTLDQIVVTATRTAQTQDQTLAPVTVITRKQIELLQPSSLQDLLNDTPGMAVSNNGGPGKATSLFLRGTESDQVLVLVDGVRIGAATLGTAPIQDIPVDQIQRIEIVRGPFSSLYGSEAIGGVIQIFLRHAPGTFTPNASTGVGSYSHWKASSGFSAASDKGWISLQATHEQTRGINACKLGAAELFVACFADQPDRDGFHDSSLSVHGAYQFNPQWSADALAMRSQGFDKFDGSTSDSDDYVTQVVGGQLHFRPNDKLNLSLRVGGSSDFDEDFLDGADIDHFDTRRSLASLQADIAAAGGLLTTGLDWQRDRVASNPLFVRDTRSARGLFAQWQRVFGPQSLQLNLRRDHNSQFGGKTTGSALWGWNFASDLRVTASYGTAFLAPSFNNLYFPGFGNPDLQPETSRNTEIGLRGTPGWGQWSVDVYRDSADDLITFDAATFAPANVDRARITGLEGVVGGKLGGWNLRATATLMNAVNDTPNSADDGRRLPRRPWQSARFDADRSFGRLSFGVSWQLNAKTWDDLANTHRLGGYALTNLRAGWAVNRNWKLQLALNNVFDKDYETAYFFNQPGRNFMLTLSYRPAVEQ